MEKFFITTRTQPPAISIGTYALMVIVLVLLLFISYKCYRSKSYQQFWKWVQGLQLVSLYGWYFWGRMSLAFSLPLYHCRLAMFGLLLLPNGSKVKQYLALMGLSGALFAIGYPVMDPYPFPHITGISFLVGHYALAVLSLLHLLLYYQSSKLSWTEIVLYTLGLNAFLVGVNQLTGGNYGILNWTPFIADQPLIIKYLAVSTILSLMLLLVNQVMQKVKPRLEQATDLKD